MDEMTQIATAPIEAPSLVPGERAIPLMGAAGRSPSAPRFVKAWAIVDEDDYEALAAFSWHQTTSGYAGRWEGGRGARRHFLMHRVILGLAAGDPRQGDHRNRNKLDNRRANIRVVEGDAQNRQNIPSVGTSKHRGVSLDSARGKYLAQVKIGGVRVLYKRFDTEREAAVAARAARDEHMPFAVD